MPSACGAFTSVRCLRSARMVARSDFSAASASEDWPAVAVHTDRTNTPRVRTSCGIILLCAPTSVLIWLRSLNTQLNRERLEQLIHLALAVRKLLEMNTDSIEKRQVQIRQRCRLGIFNVTPAFHSGG